MKPIENLFLKIIIFVVGFYLVIQGFGPGFFDEIIGPSSTSVWRPNETQFNITLVEILENPDRAILEYQNTTIIVEEGEWFDLANHTLILKIYPNKNYIWAQVK